LKYSLETENAEVQKLLTVDPSVLGTLI
jgi:hypothetical protein